MPLTTPYSSSKRIAVIGAGPAGLMAAEQIALAGGTVEVFDAMVTAGRKFLLAGVGGMNITHAEDYSTFVTRYGKARHHLQPILDDFPPEQVREWIHHLGIDTFVGSSQRVFPTDMKAAPLLRAWIHRLKMQGVVFHHRYRWVDWESTGNQINCHFVTAEGNTQQTFDAVVLALGGASWKKLGSDGLWFQQLQSKGINLNPLQPSNCGFDVAWSDHIKQRFAGTALKHIALSLTDVEGKAWRKTGEIVISEYGIEGSLIYALSAPLRDLLCQHQQAQLETSHAPALWLDWLPTTDQQTLLKKLQSSRKGASLANMLRKQLALPGICLALLKDCCPDLHMYDMESLASALKAMPLSPLNPRPIDEAISSAGGVSFTAVNHDLMLTSCPGLFIAGEMLDWEAPTGGYLLTGCFATGKRAGCGVIRWLHAG